MAKITLTPEEIAQAERDHAADLARLKAQMGAIAGAPPPSEAPVPSPARTVKRRAPEPIIIEEAFRPETRADLADQPGFDNLNVDGDGNPCVWSNNYVCGDCGTAWSDDWSAQCDDDCPKCGKNNSPEGSDWLGPEGEQVRTWQNLPNAGAPPEPERPMSKIVADTLNDKQAAMNAAIRDSLARIMPTNGGPPRTLDPAKEAVWLAMQAYCKAQEAGMTPEDLWDAVDEERAREEKLHDSEIISRYAPRWAWDTLDALMEERATGLIPGTGDTQTEGAAQMAQWAMTAACERSNLMPISRDEAQDMLEGV